MKHHNFFMTPEGREYLQKNYIDGTMSVPQIAKEHNIYPNKIYRALKYWGWPRKDRATAQKIALETGAAIHPTKGKERDVLVKRQIGRSVYEKNLQTSEEEKQRRIDKCREIWYTMDEKTREEYTKKSHRRIREAGKKGSKFEQHIVAALLANKFKLQVHHELSFVDSKKNVDIYLPMEGICIEVDGPVHFAPIFGQEALNKQIESDLEKNELLMAEGYSVIRIQNQKGSMSVSFVEDFIKKFIPYIKQIAANDKNTYNEILVTEFTLG